jgi:hypothetical protein
VSIVRRLGNVRGPFVEKIAATRKPLAAAIGAFHIIADKMREELRGM